MGQAQPTNKFIGNSSAGIKIRETANEQRCTRIDIRESTPHVAGIDTASAVPHHSRMTDPLTRPELDAKLETIEAKMEGRLARIDDRFDRLDSTIADLRVSLQSTKNAVWYAAATVIATFVAVAAVYIAAFDSGRETAAMASNAQQETAAALSEIRQIVRDLKEPPPSGQ